MRRIQTWLFADKHALRGAAMARILAGLAILGLLTTNFLSRNVLFGPGSAWAGPAREEAGFPEAALVTGHGTTFVTMFYLATMVLAALFTVGWHTRVVGPLTLMCHIAIIEQNPVVGDQGDNILRIGMIWMLFMHTSEFWSLDARGPRRRILPLWLSNAMHNAALIALGSQVVISYVVAGMFKIKGEPWGAGTALYYPLQVSQFRPLPWVNDLVTSNATLLAVATYAAFSIQLAFPFMLLNRLTRRLALMIVVGMHVSIAVLMALPWFSLSMIAFDAIFVSTATYVAFDRWIRPSWWRSSDGPRRSRKSPELSGQLPQH